MAPIVAICNSLLGLFFTLENLVHSVDVRMRGKNSQNTRHWGYVFKRGFLFRLCLARWLLLGWSHCENGQAHDPKRAMGVGVCRWSHCENGLAHDQTANGLLEN